MKTINFTKSLILLTLLLSFSKLVAQGPYWKVNGNGGGGIDAVTATSSLGPTGNYGLNIITNNTTRATITSAGKFGINKTSPSSWLHVVASGQQDVFETDVDSAYNSNWRMNRKGIEYGRIFHLSGSTPYTGDGFYIQASRGHLNFLSGDGGTGIKSMRILGTAGSDAGYVGIGDYTSFTPLRRLDIYDNGSSNPQLRLTYSTGSSGKRTDFQTTSAGNLYINPMDNTTPKGVGIGTSTVPATTKVEIDAYIPSSAASAEGLQVKSIQTTNVTDNYGAKISAEGGATNITGADVNLTNSTATYTTTGLHVNNSCVGDITAVNYGIDTKVDGAGDYFNCGAQIKTLNSANNLGLYIEAGDYNSYTGVGDNVGVRTTVSNGASAIAFDGEARWSAGDNTGVYGKATGFSNSTNTNIAVLGEAVYGTYAYGIKSLAVSGTNNYGVYATAASACTATGGIGTCTSAAGYFVGDCYTSGGTFITSDLKFKRNITNAPSTLSLINALQLKTFEYDTAQYPQMNLPYGNHYGLIAQEVESLLPQLVKNLVQPEEKDSLGVVVHPAVDFKAVNYVELIPIMLKGMQEQQATIDSLIAVIGTIPHIVNPNDPSQEKTNRIELNDSKGIILNQNDPNPFSESTTITYSIPSDVKSAKLIFSNNRGVIIREAIINERGPGSLEVYASGLSSGVYTYALIADGKVVESKKMMKAK